MTARQFTRRSPWRAIVVPIVLGTLALVLAISPAPGSARAANTYILVSLDGANWSATLPHGLFSGAGTVVPGDSISRTLWIKNTTSSPAVLRLSRLQNMAGSSLLARSISITATGRGTGKRSPAPQDASCVQLLPDQVVPGERDRQGHRLDGERCGDADRGEGSHRLGAGTDGGETVGLVGALGVDRPGVGLVGGQGSASRSSR